MKLLAIMGSPREGGNSDRLLEAFLDGFSSAGAEVRRFSIRELKISPCRECLACAQTSDCVIKDDLAEIENSLAWSDCLVIASPVFFYGFPSQFKALVDRSQAAWYRWRRLTEASSPPRPAWAILAGATRGDKLFDGMLLTLAYFLRVHGFSLAGRNLFRLKDTEEGAQIKPKHLEAARRSGRFLEKGGIL